jgi:uncharacterized phage protein (TIGR02216 family)
MAAGLGLLRLDPRSFWSMTPKELEAALRALNGSARAEIPLVREELAALMRRYPDDHSARSSVAGSGHEKDIP